ncbi:hypothetical protein ACFV3R_25415 [Streptomyces sp. NPDC059740]|uniref:hypothetical protein n=1 Tax=Streptomyces sp. NPDC059740 TaxID=3346926 RepID=UPI00365C423D
MSNLNALANKVAQLERQIRALQHGQRVSHGASIENAALQVRDNEGTLRATIGMQGDGTAAVVATNGPAPTAAPTAPLVTPSIAGLRVTWDGTLAAGSDLPADFDHIAVYISTAAGTAPSPDTFAGTIRRAGDGGVLPVTPLPYAEHYVRLAAVNTSGATGPASAETAGTPVQVDGPDLTAGSVTAGTIAAGAVTADKLEAVLSLATRVVAGDPAGARVELDASGLKAYDASGAQTVNLNGTTAAITGGTITGATVQTAVSGARIVLDENVLIYDDSGVIKAGAGPDVAPLSLPGFITTDGTFTSSLLSGYLSMYQENHTYRRYPLLAAEVQGGDLSVVTLGSGTLDNDQGQVQSLMRMSAYHSSNPAKTYPRVEFYSDGFPSSRCDVDVAGAITAGNIATGTVTITPSAPNTPTSIPVNGLNVTGTVFRGFATAQTTVPGSRAPINRAGVTGVSTSSVTGTGLLVWVNREDTTPTVVTWMVIGS